MTIDFKDDQAFAFGKPEKLAIPQFRSLCHPNDKLQKITEKYLLGKHEMSCS